MEIQNKLKPSTQPNNRNRRLMYNPSLLRWLPKHQVEITFSLPHRFMSEFDFRPLKLAAAAAVAAVAFGTEIRDIVRPRSMVGCAACGSANVRPNSVY